LKKPHGTAVDKRNGARLELRQPQPVIELQIDIPHDLAGEVLALWHAYVNASISEMTTEVEDSWFGCWASATHQYFRALQFHHEESLPPGYLAVLHDDVNHFAKELGIRTMLEALHA
jgi:hypothetical protein